MVEVMDIYLTGDGHRQDYSSLLEYLRETLL